MFAVIYSMIDVWSKYIKLICIVTGLVSLVLTQKSYAFVYPEHRKIALQSIYDLDENYRSVLDKLWLEARTGYEDRLNLSPADSNQIEDLAAIDYAAWPAIAGDHSCSASNMLYTILESDWIMDVVDVTSRLNDRLDAAGDEKYKRINALRDSDFELLAVDPLYATRAGSNNVHFLFPKLGAHIDVGDYIESCLHEDNEINAIGVYTWYHFSALSKAAYLSETDLSERERAQWVRAMLADEAFALHFLQDTFAAGHIAGSWGAASLRKGTHDYYNENGLEVTSWNGRSFVVLGDAWMRPEDARRAARSVQKSLEQLLDTAIGKGISREMSFIENIVPIPDSLNVCALNFLPSREMDIKFARLLIEVVDHTPMPGLNKGLGALPRFNAELGPFLGLTSALQASWYQSGFLQDQNLSGFIGGLELALRLGIGLEGVMNEAGDGLVFLDLGISQAVASSSSIAALPELEEFGAITATIPSRTALVSRLRMPFWLIPLDLLIAAPLLALTSPSTLTRMAVVSTNGGLLGWQSGIATSIGRFQFILGREIGVYFYGHSKNNDRVFAYGEVDGVEELLLVDVKSIQLQLPVLDYRNFRTFSRNQSSGLHMQLYVSFDIPTSVEVVVPENAVEPDYKTIFHIGLRASLDWRHYF